MEKIGFGVIGAGIFGEMHALTFSRAPQSKLVAVCDLDKKRADEIAKKYGASTVYTDYRQLLENPEVKAVSVATPDFAHREIAVACAQAGKHLLVEKPLATTVADAEAILKAAEAAKIKLMVDFHNRVNPPFVNAKQAIKNGEIGRPAYVYVKLSNTTFVATKMLSWAGKTSALWFLASHTTDLVRWLLDDEPVRVYAVTRSGILKEMGIDTQDFHVAIVEFKGGAVATFENSWILPQTEPMVYNFKFEMLGSKGSIYVNTSDHRAMEQYTEKSASLPDVLGVVPTSPLRLGGFVYESILQFVDAVANDTPVSATGRDGLAATRLLTAISQSAKSGQPVDL